MLTYEAPVEEYRFLLRDVFQVGDHDLPGYELLADDVATPILEAMGRFARERVLPLRQSADREGCTLNADGTVSTPTGFPALYRDYVEGGWPALGGPAEFGGQGAPTMLTTALLEFINGAGQSFWMYNGWGDSAVAVLGTHGTDEQRARFLPKLISGEWAATMALTEPNAGTDLGQVRTRAEPQPDGSYRITGNKIFNSGGEHDLTDNIVHFVLARIPDSPIGTRGLSLFILPKMLPGEGGDAVVPNGVICGAVEHKMGLKGSATCSMYYDNAQAWLVGKPNQGLMAMFRLMNHVRRTIGPISVGVSDLAYQNAVAYARERRAGRAISGARFPDQIADPLIELADVRRILLTIASRNDASRALALWTALQADLAERGATPEVRAEGEAMLSLLTPVTKAFLSDMGLENAVLAQQVFGGHGYVTETGVEQIVRDVRVLAIAEGANGVQGVDLALRKLGQDGGAAMGRLIALMRADIDASAGSALALVPGVRHALDDLEAATLYMVERIGGNRDDVATGATDYLHLFGLTLLGYFWVRILNGSDRWGAEDPHREARRSRARFYVERLLPETGLRLACIVAGGDTVAALASADF